MTLLIRIQKKPCSRHYGVCVRVNNGKDTTAAFAISLSAAHSSSSPGCSLFHLTPPVKPLHRISPKKRTKHPPQKTIRTIQQPYNNLHLSERRQQENSGGGKNRSSRHCFLTSCMYKTLHAFRCGTLNAVVVFLFVSFFLLLFFFPPSL